jgi:signal transduction histidine kinase
VTRAAGLALALAAVALGLAGFDAAREVPGYAPFGEGAGMALLALVAGWAATASGLASGRGLIAAAGVSWLLYGCATPAAPSGLFTLALASGFATAALLAHSLRPPPALTVLVYLTAVGVCGLATTLLLDDPANQLAAIHDEQARLAVTRAGFAATAGALIVVAAVTLARLARASSAQRLRAAPQLVFLLAAAVQLLHGLGRGFVSTDGLDRRLWIVQALALLAVAAMPGVEALRLRRARAEVARLVVELGRSGRAGGMRDVLAETLRDPRLRLLYRTGDGAWIEPDGSPAQPPEEDAARLVADGRVVGAVEHQGDAPAEELLPTARLGLVHEGLQATAHHQLSELRASRARLVAAGDAERRRLEHDLHDGAQQRLVALMLTMRLARDDGLLWAVDQLREALAELRTLAHGIYPAALAEEGLAAALETLAEGEPRLRLGALPQQRLPQPVESAAYVTALRVLRAAEGPVRVVAAQEDGALAMTLHGAAPDLDRRELEDRAGALDGAFSVNGEAFVLRLPL